MGHYIDLYTSRHHANFQNQMHSTQKRASESVIISVSLILSVYIQFTPPKTPPLLFTDIYLLCFFVLLFYLCDTRRLCRCLIRAEPFSQIESRHAKKNTHYCCYVCSLVYYIVLLFS